MLLKKKKWTPYPYQKRAVKFLLEHSCGALLLSPGLGKTSISLATIKILKDKGLINKTLIIAPLRVCYSVWPVEASEWKDFSGLKVTVLHGKHKNDLIHEESDVYVINPEGLKWFLGKFSTKAGTPNKQWRMLGFDTLIIDELSKFKNPQSKRFKMMKQFHSTFSRRWGLTGSPASNGLMDLFGQFYMIDEGRSLGKYITHYRNQYFLPDYTGFGWTLRDGAEEEIYDRISPLSLRMSAEDYLEMPKLIENKIVVTLPDKARKTYDLLENMLITQVEDKTITAASSASATIKLRQIANGGCYLDPEESTEYFMVPKDKEWENIHDAKLDALEDLIDEMQGSPILVAYEFKHDLERIIKRFGKDTPYIGGGITAARSKELETLWNEGKLPFLFGHPQSIGHGLNLQKSGNHVCWFSLTWDFELYDQFIRRVYRQGNTNSRVFNHMIVAKDTIDESIVWALKSKDKKQQSLFSALTHRAKNKKL